MGQHKYNKTAIMAKNGELPPKEKHNISKREVDRLLYEKCKEKLYKSFLNAGKMQIEEYYK